MDSIHSVIQEAVQCIRSNDRKLSAAVDQWRAFKEKDLHSYSDAFLEKRMVQRVPKASLNGSIAGVDSGFLPLELRSVFVVLVRSMGTIFQFREGKLLSAETYPTRFTFPTPTIITDSLERDEFSCSTSLHRLRAEISLSRDLIERKKPNYLLLDGSLVPQISDKPRKDSSVKNLYHAILADFQQLYKAAQQNDCALIACVEDSKGTRLRSLLESHLPNDGNWNGFWDAALLNGLLSPGERSMAFHYSDNASQHPILSDLYEEWSSRLFACYLKSAALDWPIRIEFFSSPNQLTETADNLSSIVYALSSQHREYAFPSVLIEADLRARLQPEEVRLMHDSVFDQIGNAAHLQQRRNKRPF